MKSVNSVNINSSISNTSNKVKKMKQVDMINEMMKNQQNVRNISVIAHVDHGKTTLTDSLLGKCGLLANNKIGNAVATDTLKEERDRGITIKSTSVSLCFDDNNNGQYLVNLIDCPGHIDFNSEVSSSLRITDGALLVVDCIEGVCVQTETVLKQAMNEKIKNVLFLNKMDRIFLELNYDNEKIYSIFKNTIDNVNNIITTFKTNENDESIVDNKSNQENNSDLLPNNGKVGFGSGLHGWGFTLKTFAALYSSQWGIKPESLMKKLWGDYFDHKTRQWKRFKENSKDANLRMPSDCERGFVQFVLKPLRALVDLIMNEEVDKYTPILKHLGIDGLMQAQCKDELANVKKPKDLLKIVLKTWLPAGDTLLDMIVTHLPNPIEAQSYRMEHLYTGALDSQEATILRQCQSTAKEHVPMCFYVSKMVPTVDFSRFIAFGRVFSGAIKTGQEITILDNSNNNGDMDNGNMEKRKTVKVQKCYVMMGGKYEIVNELPCGNVGGILGLDNYINNSGTLVDSQSLNEYGYKFMPLKKLHYNVSPIVEVAINCTKQSDLIKLTQALRKLNKFDNLVKIKRSECGEMIIAGAGELHLETCVNTLKTLFLNNIPITLSKPIVNYNETIIGNPVTKPIVCKSANKHNRLYCSAESLLYDSNGIISEEGNKFIFDLEQNSMHYLNMINKGKHGIKEFQTELANKYPNYHLSKSDDVLKIWSFGCIPGDSSFSNMICDKSKGIQLLKEIKSDVVSSFEQVTLHGVLCGEPLRGVKFNVLDAKIHSDKMHRNGAAVIPMTRRALYGCQLYYQSRLMQPMYKVEVVIDKQSQLNGIYNTLHERHGIIENVSNGNNNSTKIEAILPVSHSFGFTNLLRANTQGTAFPTMQFSHWSVIESDPFVVNSNNKNDARNIILNIRKRKGMKEEMPQFNDYYDKIN